VAMLCCAQKTSKRRAILWLFEGLSDHLWRGPKRPIRAPASVLQRDSRYRVTLTSGDRVFFVLL
jgi:hypothetical protein